MTFTVDWFSWHIKTWKQYLSHFANVPDLRFLEIGCYEGRATVWLLENILTERTANIEVIDVFDDQTEEYKKLKIDNTNLLHRFLENVKGYPGKVKVDIGLSYIVLRQLPLNTYHFIYVDGAHTALNTLEDAVLAWRLLKKDGIMVFDDYDWNVNVGTLNHPKIGVDAFLQTYEGQYEILHKQYQVILKKVVAERG